VRARALVPGKYAQLDQSRAYPDSNGPGHTLARLGRALLPLFGLAACNLETGSGFVQIKTVPVSAVSQPALYFDQLVGRKEVQFDWQKFTWIGNTTVSHHLLYMRADTPYKTIEDIRKAAVAPKCGAEGTASSAYYLPKLLEETIGAKFNVVTGYNSGTDVDLAVERGEVQCRAFTIAAFFAREPFATWRKKGFVRVIIQTGKKRDSKLPDVPTLPELMDQTKTSDSARRLASVILAANEIGRPIIATPGIPADRVQILREAFVKAVNDPELLADAKKKRLEFDPVSGEDLQTLASEIVTQPPEVIERMKKLLGT